MSYFRLLRRANRGVSWVPKLKIQLTQFDSEFYLILFGLFIPLPCLNKYATDAGFGDEPQWGFYHMEREMWFWWGRHYYVLRYPWDYVHVRHSVMRVDGAMVPFVGSWERKDPDERHIESHPFRYTLLNGTVQDRVTTVYVEEREWVWRWFKWLGFPRKIRRSLNIDFNDEVGERTGSWKGGVLGTACDIHNGETPLQALRRFEKECKL